MSGKQNNNGRTGPVLRDWDVVDASQTSRKIRHTSPRVVDGKTVTFHRDRELIAIFTEPISCISAAALQPAPKPDETNAQVGGGNS